MTPSNLMSVDQIRLLTPKEKNKLRKPMIEKMRRDRMNGSIEKLKQLLEKQLQAGSKPEKANVLEMAVNYLKHQNQAAAGPPAPKERSGLPRRLRQMPSRGLPVPAPSHCSPADPEETDVPFSTPTPARLRLAGSSEATESPKNLLFPLATMDGVK